MRHYLEELSQPPARWASMHRTRVVRVGRRDARDQQHHRGACGARFSLDLGWFAVDGAQLADGTGRDASWSAGRRRRRCPRRRGGVEITLIRAIVLAGARSGIPVASCGRGSACAPRARSPVPTGPVGDGARIAPDLRAPLRPNSGGRRSGCGAWKLADRWETRPHNDAGVGVASQHSPRPNLCAGAEPRNRGVRGLPELRAVFGPGWCNGVTRSAVADTASMPRQRCRPVQLRHGRPR